MIVLVNRESIETAGELANLVRDVVRRHKMGKTKLQVKNKIFVEKEERVLLFKVGSKQLCTTVKATPARLKLKI